MTPRDVLSLLSHEQRAEIAAVCLEYMTPEDMTDVLSRACTEYELAEVGIAIRRLITKNSSTD